MNMWLVWEGILMVFNVEELVRTSYQHETQGVAHFVQVVEELVAGGHKLDPLVFDRF